MTDIFANMDDFGMGVSLYESEMETDDVSEEETHMQRCIAKGKRAKRMQRNNLFWWRHREWPSWVGNVLADRRRSAQVRSDNVVLSQSALRTNPEEYDTLDVMPGKHRRY